MKRLVLVVLAIVSGEVASQESVPSLRLHIDGAADPSSVRVEYMLAGPFGGYRTQLRGSANHIDIPIVVDGRRAQSLKAMVFSPGHRIARIEIQDVAAQTDLRVALEPLPVGRLTGTVKFVGGANPRSFVLEIDVMVGSSQQFFGIADGPLTTFDVAEAVVSAAGDFSAVVPDLAEDKTFQSAHIPSVFQFHARDATTRNFVFDLMPREVAIKDLPRAMVLSASPRLH